MVGSRYQAAPPLSMLEPLGSTCTAVAQVGLTPLLHPDLKLPQEELVRKGYDNSASLGTKPSWSWNLWVPRNHPIRQRSSSQMAAKMPGRWQGRESSSSRHLAFAACSHRARAPGHMAMGA